jgi:uncharacterized glyoxalase superfamily protein PhnB
VDNLKAEFENAIQARAMLISPPKDRDWGDKVCYYADLDGHILAFAEKVKAGFFFL